MCGICTNNYGGKIVPIMMMCCANHVCFDCVEKDRVVKIANLTRNRKKINCIYCTKPFHSKNDTPWQISKHFMQANGIKVDTKAMREVLERGLNISRDETQRPGDISEVEERNQIVTPAKLSPKTADISIDEVEWSDRHGSSLLTNKSRRPDDISDEEERKHVVTPPKLSQVTAENNMDEVEWASENPKYPSPPEYAPRPKSSELEDPCNCVSKRNKRKGTTDSPTMLCTDNQCVLFACMEECRSDCKAGDLCGNQRITKKQWKKLQVFKAESNRKGVITLEDAKDGDFLIEYTGVAIKRKYVDSLFQRYGTETVINAMVLDKDIYIDATRKGSIARYINLSSEPNCAVYRWKVEGIPRAGVFAIKDIESGTELFLDSNSKI